MIRINLLGGERKATRKAFAFETAHKLAAGCTAILIGAAAILGWRYYLLQRDSERLDREIARAQQQAARLHSVIAQVQQFEQRKTQLQQRVTLIEQLRKERTGPVHMLDQISRALPPMLWLTEVRQTESSNEVLIAGRCTTLTGLSDFVANLEASGYFKRSVEIVSSTTETIPTPPGELIEFQIKALFQQPADTATPPPGN